MIESMEQLEQAVATPVKNRHARRREAALTRHPKQQRQNPLDTLRQMEQARKSPPPPTA